MGGAPGPRHGVAVREAPVGVRRPRSGWRRRGLLPYTRFVARVAAPCARLRESPRVHAARAPGPRGTGGPCRLSRVWGRGRCAWRGWGAACGPAVRCGSAREPVPARDGGVPGPHRRRGVSVAGRAGSGMASRLRRAQRQRTRAGEGAGARRGRTTHWSRPRQGQPVLQVHRPWRGGSPPALD